jgi:hypothetical protein
MALCGADAYSPRQGRIEDGDNIVRHDERLLRSAVVEVRAAIC